MLNNQEWTLDMENIKPVHKIILFIDFVNKIEG